MQPLEIHQFAVLSDNYCVLIHDRETGETAAIDAADSDAILKALQQKRWSLTHLLITHHHWDHTDGLSALKSATGCKVIGPSYSGKDKEGPVKGLDETVSEGDAFTFGGRRVEVLHTPGHTLDMVNYYIPDDRLVFTGDTLFALGCGRIFEGDAQMMWKSLEKLAALPPSTHVYCGHEYTEANARFCLTVDPDNQKLQRRAGEIAELRSQGRPTVPTTIRMELETNPFLRAADHALRRHLGMEGAQDWQVFAEIRARKDRA